MHNYYYYITTKSLDEIFEFYKISSFQGGLRSLNPTKNCTFMAAKLLFNFKLTMNDALEHPLCRTRCFIKGERYFGFWGTGGHFHNPAPNHPDKPRGGYIIDALPSVQKYARLVMFNDKEVVRWIK